MIKKEFKVGDVVKIKQDLNMNEDFGILVASNMLKYKGKYSLITDKNEYSIGKIKYSLKEDDGRYFWTQDMLEEVPEITNVNYYTVEVDELKHIFDSLNDAATFLQEVKKELYFRGGDILYCKKDLVKEGIIFFSEDDMYYAISDNTLIDDNLDLHYITPGFGRKHFRLANEEDKLLLYEYNKSN